MTEGGQPSSLSIDGRPIFQTEAGEFVEGFTWGTDDGSPPEGVTSTALTYRGCSAWEDVGFGAFGVRCEGQARKCCDVTVTIWTDTKGSFQFTEVTTSNCEDEYTPMTCSKAPWP